MHFGPLTTAQLPRFLEASPPLQTSAFVATTGAGRTVNVFGILRAVTHIDQIDVSRAEGLRVASQCRLLREGSDGFLSSRVTAEVDIGSNLDKPW